MRVLVIGGTRGIGRAIAEELAQDTYVAITGMTHESADNALFRKLVAREALDVTIPGNVKAFFEKPNYYDAIVYCAGYANPSALSVLTPEDMRKTFAVNVEGAMLVAKYARPIIPKGGKMVFIASSSGMQARPGWSAYAASKAALINFTSSLSMEMAPYGIKVFTLSPGRTATGLRRTLAPAEDPDTIMTPRQVAKVVRFLLSPDGDVMSTYPIRIHGGTV